MSLELIIRWEDGETSELEHGAHLIDVLEDTDALAEVQGLRTLSSYADDREIPDGFDGDITALAELLGPNPVWHTTPEAYENLHALAGHATGDTADGLRELASTLRRDTRAFQLDVLG